MRTRNVWLPIACLALASVVPAQRQTIQPSAKIKRTEAVVQNTWNVFPQINPSKGPDRVQDTNEREVPRLKAGPANGLRASRTVLPNLVLPAEKPRWPGIGATGWTPPDPTAAVGPTHVVMTVNSDIGFFTRTGVKVFQQGLGPGGFFDGVATTSFAFDPKALYDPISKRFFVICCELDQAASTSGMLVAVSETSDPRGRWKKYRVDTKLTEGGNSYWLDYPGFGFNKDRIVFTGNMFGFTSGWAGVSVFSLSKANLIAGNTDNSFTYRLPAEGSMQWTKSFDPTLAVSYGGAFASTTGLKIAALTNTAQANSPLELVTVNVPEWQYPSSARSTEGRRLDALDARMLTMAFRSGRIVGSHGIKTPTGTNVVARWYDIKTNGWPTKAGAAPSLAQSGEVAGTAEQDSFMPGININRYGALGFVFSRSSTSLVADVMVAGRRSTDTPGAMSRPVSMASSVGAYGSPGGNRWGDYFSVEVDPLDSRTFWGVGMTSLNGNWQTQLVSWTVLGDNGSGKAMNPISANVYAAQGILQTGNLDSLYTADGAAFNVRSVLVPNLGRAAALEIGFKSSILPAKIAAASVKVRTKGPLKGTTMVWLYNQIAKKYEHIQSKPCTSQWVMETISLEPDQLAKYMTSTGAVKAVVRTLIPGRQNNVGSFVMNVDQAVLVVLEDQ